MINVSEDSIKEFLNKYDYDVRKTHDARWIDQKCTIDVISLIADCVMEYVKNDFSKEFTANDIWHNEYTVKNVQEIFSKPNPNEKAKNEYDKYFSQPLRLLAYSNVLSIEKRGRNNYYRVNNKDILQYISFRERNALEFLNIYIEKVLRDSKIYDNFDCFFINPNNETFICLKESFKNFIINNTKINGAVECGRIFTKVLNPLAYKKNSYGTRRGRLSRDIITFNELLYNQKNWRDIYSHKPKGMTREEYKDSMEDISKDNMIFYKISKAKRILREYNEMYNNAKSELYNEDVKNDKATHIHHIFPAAYFPEISDYIENLIALTPTQHLNQAHPAGNTQKIDYDYQYCCLLAKTGEIKKNLKSNCLPHIYTFDDFKYVLNVGFETNQFDLIDNMNFELVVMKIEELYYFRKRNNLKIAENEEKIII